MVIVLDLRKIVLFLVEVAILLFFRSLGSQDLIAVCHGVVKKAIPSEEDGWSCYGGVQL